jgi:small subunit ribosomal protein S8
VYNGLGIAILSTPRGIMAGQKAWRQQTGGEVLCYVW